MVRKVIEKVHKEAKEYLNIKVSTLVTIIVLVCGVVSFTYNTFESQASASDYKKYNGEVQEKIVAALDKLNERIDKVQKEAKDDYKQFNKELKDTFKWFVEKFKN